MQPSVPTRGACPSCSTRRGASSTRRSTGLATTARLERRPRTAQSRWSVALAARWTTRGHRPSSVLPSRRICRRHGVSSTRASSLPSRSSEPRAPRASSTCMAAMARRTTACRTGALKLSCKCCAVGARSFGWGGHASCCTRPPSSGSRAPSRRARAPRPAAAMSAATRPAQLPRPLKDRTPQTAGLRPHRRRLRRPTRVVARRRRRLCRLAPLAAS